MICWWSGASTRLLVALSKFYFPLDVRPKSNFVNLTKMHVGCYKISVTQKSLPLRELRNLYIKYLKKYCHSLDGQTVIRSCIKVF